MLKKYAPILAVFGMAFLMSFAAAWKIPEWNVQTYGLLFETFVALSMCILAVLKLQDLDAFAARFIQYDMVSQKFPLYAKIYPFAEAFVGVGMIAGLFMPVTPIVAIVIGGAGALSVIRAINNQRKLPCACVGGHSHVPLGFISLIENLMMFGIGIWMLV